MKIRTNSNNNVSLLHRISRALSSFTEALDFDPHAAQAARIARLEREVAALRADRS